MFRRYIDLLGKFPRTSSHRAPPPDDSLPLRHSDNARTASEARALRRAGNAAAAETPLRRAIAAGGANAELLAELGLALAALDRFNEAASLLLEAQDQGCDSPEVPPALIRAARRANRDLDVSSVVATARDRRSLTVSLLLEAAQFYWVRKESMRALEMTDQAMRISTTAPERSLSTSMSAQYLSIQGRHEEAIHRIQAFIDASGVEEPDVPMLEALGRIAYLRRRTSYADNWTAYWAQRKDFVYVHVCRQLIRAIAPSAQIVADIGSNRTPTLDYFENATRKYSVDPANPYRGPGVVAVTEDFLRWTPPEKINVITCFQVMEHVSDPEAFAGAILEKGEVAIVSVPYQEQKGANPGHIHSMIDYDVVCRWFQREPNFHYIAQELSGDCRIVAVFDTKTRRKFIGLHEESQDALRFRFRWSVEGSGIALRSRGAEAAKR